MGSDRRPRCKSCRRSRFVEFAPGSTRCRDCIAGQSRPANQDSLLTSAYLYGPTTDAIRGQLIEAVIEGVFTSDHRNAGHMSMLGRMQDTHVQESPILRHATEAVIFSRLALNCKDQAIDLQQRAQHAYGHTIGHLAHVANPEAALTHRTPARSVLSAMMLMGYPPVCQQFKASSSVHQDMHIRGQYSYFSACDASAFDWTSKEDVDFYRQLNWPLAFTQMVHLRNSSELRLPSWKPNFRALEHFGYAQETIMLPWTVSRLPDLLSRVDRVMKAPLQVTQSGLHRLDRCLCHALATVSVPKPTAEAFPSTDILDVVHVVQNQEQFDDSIEEHKFMKNQKMLETFFRFRPQRSPYPHEPSVQVAWIIQILVVSAMLRLRSLNGFESKKGSSQLEQWALERATDVCRSVWYLSKSPGIAHAHWIKVLLHVSETIFDQSGEVASSRLAWTRGCLEANRARIGRLGSGSVSFCMVGEMAQGLPSQCRWKKSSAVGAQCPVIISNKS